MGICWCSNSRKCTYSGIISLAERHFARRFHWSSWHSICIKSRWLSHQDCQWTTTSAGFRCCFWVLQPSCYSTSSPVLDLIEWMILYITCLAIDIVRQLGGCVEKVQVWSSFWRNQTLVQLDPKALVQVRPSYFTRICRCNTLVQTSTCVYEVVGFSL